MSTPRGEQMLDKVRKLFAQAKSVAGTPEAEAFEERAFALIAKHGIDELEARRAAGDSASDYALCRRFTIEGPYPKQQKALLTRIADAFHCSSVLLHGHHTVEVFGIPEHIYDAHTLFSILNPQMLAQAARQQNYGTASSTRKYRSSWMLGYSSRIHGRLVDAQKTAVAESADSSGNELVLHSDEKKAAALMNEIYPTLRKPRTTTIDRTAYDGGIAAANKANLGGTTLTGTKTAINA